jgi:hypothetical protein
MDPVAIVESLMFRFQGQGVAIERQETLSLSDCFQQFADKARTQPLESTALIRPVGGILHFQHVPLLFLHCLRPKTAEESLDAAECAVFLRITEMFFSGQDLYPVLFVVEGGSPEFWMYIRIFQMGCEGNRNPYKIAGHSVPIVIPYTTLRDAVDIGEAIMLDALNAAAVPAAER